MPLTINIRGGDPVQRQWDDGLRDAPKGHAKRALTPEQEEKLAGLVMQGPPDGTLVRWRRVDLRAVIKREFSVDYHERSVGKILHRLGFFAPFREAASS